jgi:shikimate dehydrogenase
MSSILQLRQFLESTHTEAPFAAVLGNPIGHSLSPLIHNMAFRFHGINAHYYPILVENIEYSYLLELFSHPNFIGANVTIPLKSVVMDYIVDKDKDVVQSAACNTVYRNESGIISGANTDILGFIHPLLEYKEQLKGQDAIAFGTGGASKAIILALKSIGIKNIYLVSRKNTSGDLPKNVSIVSYEEWPKLAPDTGIFINSTPLGMHPNEEKSPVNDIQKEHLIGKICYDVIYNPSETLFLKQAYLMGCKTINGLPMFISQAAAAFYLFTGKEFPVREAELALRTHLKLE